MKTDPSECLRVGAEVVRTRGSPLPIETVIRGLRPATQFRAEKATEESFPAGGSRFGGRPDLPPSTAWPRWEGFPEEKKGKRRTPGREPSALSFLAQLDLAEIPAAEGLLPDSGRLLFFYDAVQQPWGFDPRDRGCARVLYVRGEGVSLRRADPPPGLPSDGLFAPCRLAPALTATLPRWSYQLGLELDEAAGEVYWELAEQHVAGAEPHHRLLGWPKQVQGDMDFECQLVSNGIYCGRPEGYQSPEAERLKPGAADWTMLLQLDTDEAGPGFMWGDAGCLYFWIRKQDLAARRFENAWAILQCY